MSGGPRIFADMPDGVTDVVPTHRGHFCAPDLIHHHVRHLVYDSISSFGKNTSAIALVSNTTLDLDDP